jgi:hypothetical protein
VGKRSRARARAGRGPEPLPGAPAADYTSPAGDVLTLRGAMTAGTRTAYRRALAGEDRAPGAAREDAWQRAVELLFERLAVRWVVGGVPAEGEKELLLRFRAATPDERGAVRAALREHLAEHFPELPAP